MTCSSAPRSVASRSGVPSRNSPPAASIALALTESLVVALTAWPFGEQRLGKAQAPIRALHDQDSRHPTILWQAHLGAAAGGGPRRPIEESGTSDGSREYVRDAVGEVGYNAPRPLCAIVLSHSRSCDCSLPPRRRRVLLPVVLSAREHNVCKHKCRDMSRAFFLWAALRRPPTRTTLGPSRKRAPIPSEPMPEQDPQRRRGHDGQDRGAVQAPRLHLPLLGDLRRRRLDV